MNPVQQDAAAQHLIEEFERHWLEYLDLHGPRDPERLAVRLFAAWLCAHYDLTPRQPTPSSSQSS